MCYQPKKYRQFVRMVNSALKQNCVMCDKAIDLETDEYETGESLGEYWCGECVESVSE